MVNPSSFQPEINPSRPSSPTAKQKISPESQAVIKELKETLDLAASRKAQMHSRSIAPAASGGAWNSIKTFFNRRFSKITETEKNQAHKINMLIGKVEQDFDELSRLAKKTVNEEKKFYRTPSNEQSVKVNSDYLMEARTILIHARDDLNKLKTEENIALQLAEEHSTFDALPEQIKSLEKKVHLLEAQVVILEKLVDLEIAMKDYHPNEDWDQFIAVEDKKIELMHILKKLCQENPVLKEDAEIQKYYLKKERWDAIEMRELITSRFPGLNKQAERLLNHSIDIQAKRIANMNKKVETLEPLFAQYHSHSKKINNLEYFIHNDSLGARISKTFHIFQKRKNLKEEVLQLKAEQAAIYNKITSHAIFNLTELDWLAEIGKFNPKNIGLRRDIENVIQELVQLNLRHKISVQVTELHEHLELYHKHTRPNAKDIKFINLETLKKTIIEDILKLSGDVQNWHFRARARDLPKNFTKTNVLNQLKAVISVFLPTLQQRNEKVFLLIEKLGLNKELNQAVLDREFDTIPKLKNVGSSGDIGSPEDVELPKDAGSPEDVTPAKETRVEETEDIPLPPSPPPLAPLFSPSQRIEVEPKENVTPPPTISSELLSTPQVEENPLPPAKVFDIFSQIRNKNFELKHMNVEQIEKDKFKVKPVDHLMAEIEAGNLKIDQNNQLFLVNEDAHKLASLQENWEKLTLEERLAVQLASRNRTINPEDEDVSNLEDEWQ